MTERTTEPEDSPLGDAEGHEGGKAAAGERTGTRGQLDGASGGYGSQSGTGSSGGSGEGEADAAGDGSGAAGESSTDWLRRA
jgi:hypothetical protein